MNTKECIRIRASAEGGSDSGIEDPALLSEESDVVPQTMVRSSDLSPRHRRPSWDARYPRTIYENKHLSQTSAAVTHLQLPHVRSRRMSDPGVKAKLAHARHHDVTDEAREEDDEFDEDAPAYASRRSSLTSLHAPYARTALSTRLSRTRERASSSGALPPIVRRSHRSFSLPSPDGVVMEINEAVGALAISRSSSDKPSVRIEPIPPPQHALASSDVTSKHCSFSAKMSTGSGQMPSFLLVPPAAGACVRRRSLSTEPYSGLESIEEEAGSSRYNRRYSTPHLER